MPFDLSKLVLRPDDEEALVVGPPAVGRIIIKADPRNAGRAVHASFPLPRGLRGGL
jgi:hypothetical protein